MTLTLSQPTTKSLKWQKFTPQKKKESEKKAWLFLKSKTITDKKAKWNKEKK